MSVARARPSGGVSTLSLGSLLALAGVVSGAVLGLRYPTWRMEQMT